MNRDLTTTLRSEVAALEYKRDRLTSEELEERERHLYGCQGRYEATMKGLERDSKYREEKIREYEKKVEELEERVSEEVESKERARSGFQEFARKLWNALSIECRETVSSSNPEIAVRKVEELAEEASRLRAVEVDLRSCRDALDRSGTEKEQLQRQVSSQLIDLDRLRQDKECLEMRYRIAERELKEVRDKLANANRSVSSASGKISSQEASIGQLREDLKHREEKAQRVQTELRHLLESLAILISGPNRFVESEENAIKDRIREILAEKKDQALSIENLRERVSTATESTTRQGELIESTVAKMRNLEEERSSLEGKVRKLESELNGCELSKECLRREKQTFVTFLERLGKAMQMDEISEEMGVDLQTESLLVRAEQLARFETEKLVDKVM
ncbi:Coiled-coil domain-containing protein 170 [Habropoda laboriosa]|uniref:Coiled-coil domain-containing protein 170 n=1 Tax=Habropoda laboriosa TaxID=597456 RepID=A0A0L7RDW3_9HYME|nr:Coiled-coil domain-containing protein 170 [Habropoda laboriosa]